MVLEFVCDNGRWLLGFKLSSEGVFANQAKLCIVVLHVLCRKKQKSRPNVRNCLRVLSSLDYSLSTPSGVSAEATKDYTFLRTWVGVKECIPRQILSLSYDQLRPIINRVTTRMETMVKAAGSHIE